MRLGQQGIAAHGESALRILRRKVLGTIIWRNGGTKLPRESRSAIVKIFSRKFTSTNYTRKIKLLEFCRVRNCRWPDRNVIDIKYTKLFIEAQKWFSNNEVTRDNSKELKEPHIYRVCRNQKDFMPFLRRKRNSIPGTNRDSYAPTRNLLSKSSFEIFPEYDYISCPGRHALERGM